MREYPLVRRLKNRLAHQVSELKEGDLLRRVYACAAVTRGAATRLTGNHAATLHWACEAERNWLGDQFLPAQAIYRWSVGRCIRSYEHPERFRNLALEAFLASPESAALRASMASRPEDFRLTLKQTRNNDYPERQGNLVVLKRYRPESGERGVLFLKFTDTIKDFVSLYDLNEIAQRYRLLVQPSTWGYMDILFHYLIHPGLDVLIQAQDEPDARHVARIGHNLRTVRLGSGDWIDSTTFSAGEPTESEKSHDLAMVASWLPLKRHRILFRALARMRPRPASVVLVGYPIDGYTSDDIMCAASDEGVAELVTVLENIPPEEVARTLRRSRASIILSRKEGAIKALYESLFCDVPIILHAGNRGVNKAIVNAMTGRLASDEALARVLAEVLADTSAFSPRAWAIENTGMDNARRIVTDRFTAMARAAGEPFEHPLYRIRAGRTPYMEETDRLDAEAELSVLRSCLRD